MRDLKCLSWWYCSRTCLHTRSSSYVGCLLSSSYLQAACRVPAERPRYARRSSSTGMVKVRRKNVMRKVAS